MKILYTVLSLLILPFVQCEEISSRSIQSFVHVNDLIVLRDGSKIEGKLEVLSPLHFSFDNLAFKQGEISLILFPLGQKTAQYITKNGLLFEGEPTQNTISILTNNGLKTLNINQIEYILCKPKELNKLTTDQKMFQLITKDGYQFPVIIQQESILLSEGKIDEPLSVNAIHQLRFEGGGLRGEVKKDGRMVKLGLHFARDKYLAVTVAEASCDLKIAWDSIYSLEETEPFSLNESIARHLEPPGVGALVYTDQYFIEPASNSAIVSIGHKSLGEAPAQLFSGKEHFEHFQDIVFDFEDRELFEDHFISLVVAQQESEDHLAYEAPKSLLKKQDNESVEIESSAYMRGLRAPPVASEEKVTPLLGQIPPQLIGMAYLPPEQTTPSLSPGCYFDKTPVTNAQYKQFVDATHYRAPIHWIGGRIPPGLEKAPVVNVSYKDATTYAIWAGKRLPSDAEWQRASQKKEILQPPIMEWTAITYNSKNGRDAQYYIGQPTNQSQTSFKGLRNNSNGEMKVMYKDDYNSLTGFRCALDSGS